MSSQIDLPRSTPEAQGLPSSAVLEFLNGIDAHELELHSVMLLRHGSVIAEGWWAPYARDRIHLLYSLSKSFASSAVGLAVAEGRIALDDRVIDFFPESQPAEIGADLAAMRIRHLLCMGTGHRSDTGDHMTTAAGDDWIAGVLGIPPDQAPGSVFTYNQGATFLLSAIVQTVTGLTLTEYLQPRLFTPLGIDRYFWQRNPQGIDLGYTGLHLTTEAVARLGQLYLQQGMWAGEQLLPRDWVQAASSRQIASGTPGASSAEEQNADWIQGYGYQFWRCRYNAYRGDGAFGQFCLVMPDQDAVLAITAGTGNMQGVLDQVWAHLLPAFTPAPLPEQSETHAVLGRRLADLAYPPVSGRNDSPAMADVAGMTYRFAAGQSASDDPSGQIDTLKLLPNADGLVLAASRAGHEHRVQLGFGHWRTGTTTLFAEAGDPATETAGSCAWSGEDTLTMQIRFIETPHALTLAARFTGDAVELNGYWNVGFWPEQLATQRGTRS